MTFPLSSPPAGFAVCSFPNNRAGIFYYNEETPIITLDTSVSCTYTVRDYFGNVVSSGNANGTSVTPTAPTGGWKPGWYRFYLDGGTVDPVYGTSLGATNFIVIRDDSRFPPRPALGYGTGKGSGHGGGEAQDEVTKGLLGMGSPSRRQIADASNPFTNLDGTGLATTVAPYIQEFWSNPTHTAYLDAQRPRYMWIQFPGRTYDRIDIHNGVFARVYCKDETIDGSTVFVEVTGSAGNWTVNIYSPDSTTLVESYTGLTNGQDLEDQTATSNYVRAFHAGSSGIALAPTAIGNAFFNGTKSAVSTLYAQGYTRFEGPVNEGNLGPELAHRTRLFAAAVHAGNASAKAIGPCVVQIDNGFLSGSTLTWDGFLSVGGAGYLDEISTHAYNSVTNGNLAQGRVIMDAWQAKLAQYGADTKLRWISESTQVFTSVYGVLHPRRARVVMMELLLMEQYKIPREQNLIWYDQSHGFWSQPDMVLNSDNSLQPFAAMCRVLAEETFGFPYSSKLDFGTTTANAIFLGSVYKTASGGVVALISASHIDNAVVTLAISGTSGPLTVVDAFGNESTVALSGGHAVIPVDDIPTYVRLPAGASATAYSVLDWSPSQQDSISTSATSYTVGGTSAPAIADGGWLTNYGPGTGIYISPNALPEDAIISFSGSKMVGGVVVFCGAAWQHGSAFVDFDVMTTDDGGSTWTTQKTVTKTTPSSFTHGCDSNNSGCKQETYWDEQWIFPVKFDLPVSATGVKIHVRATSYGGEPDSAAISAGGQGQSTQAIALQEIAILPGNSTYAYQWKRSGVNIAGATSSTYTTVSADAGNTIGCTVTATTDGGSNSAASNTLSIVTPAKQQIGIPILSS